MLAHLIHKEILDQILSLRFLLLSVIGALTIWLSLYDGYTYYQDRLKDDRLARTATEERLRHFTQVDGFTYNPLWEFSGIGFKEHKPPTALSIFVRGLDSTLGRSIATGYTQGRKLRRTPVEAEPVLGLFPSLDLALVVKLVLSLFVLLLTFDAVCGEKESGTLRLTTSFPVPAYRIMLSKYLGTLIPILAAFGLPLLLGVALLLLAPGVTFSGPEWMRLGLILGGFALYVAVFTCAGIFGSTLTHRPATSFVLLLTFWTITVVVIPRLSLIVADRFRPAPSNHEHQARVQYLRAQNPPKWRAVTRKWWEEQERLRPEWLDTPEGREAGRRVYTEIRDKVHAEFAPQLNRLEEAFRNQYRTRLDLAVQLARLSPPFALNNALVTLSGTGIDRHLRFENSFETFFRNRYSEWARAREDRNALKRANPGKYGEYEWEINGLPRLAYREPWPREDLQQALADLGILSLWGLLFFTCACLAMARYDFR